MLKPTAPWLASTSIRFSSSLHTWSTLKASSENTECCVYWTMFMNESVRTKPVPVWAWGKRFKLWVNMECTKCFGNHTNQSCQSRKILWLDYVAHFAARSPEFPKVLYLICCIFWPMFGCCSLQMLVKICFFNIYNWTDFLFTLNAKYFYFEKINEHKRLKTSK